MTTEDVRPLCIFCHQRYSLAAGQETPCPDPRTVWGHVELMTSTREQRDARFGPPAVRPDVATRAPEPVREPQMGFGL